MVVYKFTRRLMKLTTKRGGRLRAFRNLQILLHSVKLSRKQKILLRSKKRVRQNPVFTAVSNLKTYFFLRKFTKARKTIFLPGILAKRRRLRVAARWLALSVKKAPERRLYERFLAAINETARGAGLARQTRNAFNKSVGISKANLNTRRRHRFQKRPVLKAGPTWAQIMKILKPKYNKKYRSKPP
jgi:ribosomal protein S7